MTKLAETIARDHYGLEGSVTPLPGEFDKNYLETTVDGHKSILKIMREGCSQAFIEMQIKAVGHAFKADAVHRC